MKNKKQSFNDQVLNNQQQVLKQEAQSLQYQQSLSQNEQLTNSIKEVYTDVYDATKITNIKTVYFNKDVMVFLNYINKVTFDDFELTIRKGFLFIKDLKTGYVCLVPVENINSVQLQHD